MSFDQKTREADRIYEEFEPPTEANRIYEEFEPPTDWDRDDVSDTLIVMLPGYKKEQMKVQVTTARVLRISGERQISNNKYRRFRKEIKIPSHSDTNSIAAKFESGILYIRLPKLINNNNNQQQNVSTQEPQKPQQPIIPHQPNTTQVSDQKKQQEPKKDEEEKPKKENGKAEELKKDDDDDVKNKVEKRSETTRQRYVNALCGLVDEIKKQKKFVNLLLLVLMFGLYVKSVIKSLFSGGHKSQEL